MSQLGTTPSAVWDRLPGLDKQFVANTSAGTITPVSAGGGGILRHTQIVLSNTEIDVIENGTATNGGGGGIRLGTFPRGVIVWVNTNAEFSTVGVSGGVSATATPLYRVGRAQADASATLSANEVVFGSAGADDALVGGLGTTTVVASSANLNTNTITGDPTPIELWLNVGVADAGLSANGKVRVSGYVNIVWMHVGDATGLNANGRPSFS